MATKRGTTSNKDNDCRILAELDPQRPVDVADPDYIAQKYNLTEKQRRESELDKLSYKNRANDYWLVEAISSHKKKPSGLEFQIKFKGFEEPEWHPLDRCDGCLAFLKDYIQEFEAKNPASKVFQDLELPKKWAGSSEFSANSGAWISSERIVQSIKGRNSIYFKDNHNHNLCGHKMA